MTENPTSILATPIHATCVAIGGRGLLIIGPSGSGKSALALQLLALDAALISDDQTLLTKSTAGLTASAPAPIAGLIEARGIGILSVAHTPSVPVHLVVDMGQVETKRLPDAHVKTVLDVSLPCLHKVDSPYFPSALMLYMKSQR